LAIAADLASAAARRNRSTRRGLRSKHRECSRGPSCALSQTVAAYNHRVCRSLLIARSPERRQGCHHHRWCVVKAGCKKLDLSVVILGVCYSRTHRDGLQRSSRVAAGYEWITAWGIHFQRTAACQSDGHSQYEKRERAKKAQGTHGRPLPLRNRGKLRRLPEQQLIITANNRPLWHHSRCASARQSVVFGKHHKMAPHSFAFAFRMKISLVAQGQVHDAPLA
jgi:hypothetical protein